MDNIGKISNNSQETNKIDDEIISGDQNYSPENYDNNHISNQIQPWQPDHNEGQGQYQESNYLNNRQYLYSEDSEKESSKYPRGNIGIECMIWVWNSGFRNMLSLFIRI